MKARVKATGEIVEVYSCGERYLECSNMNKSWWEEELDFEVTDKDVIYNKGWQNGWDEAVRYEIPKIHPKLKGSDPDYWTRLEHQYAGMAMQGLVTRGEVLGATKQEIAIEIADISDIIAHALVEKMKEERK